MSRWHLWLILLLTWWLLFLPMITHAGDDYREVVSCLMSPTCPAERLEDCRSYYAEEMRQGIKDMLARGMTKAEILDHFVQLYGVQILSSPPKKGFFLVAWLGPYLALLLGGVAILVTARRWVALSGRTRSAGPSLPPVEDEGRYQERIDRDLRNYY